MRRRSAGTAMVWVMAASMLSGPAAVALTGETVRVSLAHDGEESDGGSGAPSPSSDGRVVAFSSEAANLVEGDTNGVADVFVRDRVTGTTSRVSVASDGTEADAPSGDPSISGDGRVVAFSSEASNLVEGDTNGVTDVFVHDRAAGTTVRVSLASDGSQGDGPSGEASVSADGEDIAFTSEATSLVEADTNGVADVFAHERASARTIRVSVRSSGGEANGASRQPAISAGEVHVAFTSEATNLAAGDTNGVADVFVRDGITEVTTRVSVASDGTQADGPSGEPSVSSSTRFVAFSSTATNLVPGDSNGVADVFVHDGVEDTTTRASVAGDGAEADGPSGDPAMSGPGDRVAFTSTAANLAPGGAAGMEDVYVRDREGQTTDLVSLALDGGQADGPSTAPAMGIRGEALAFTSEASNLVADDANGVADVFLHSLAVAEEEPCPPDELAPAAFADREAIPEAHRGNVDCAAHLAVVQGFADNTFRPALLVRRDQMASFIARSLDAAGIELPSAEQQFDDVPAGSPHAGSIGRLAEAGIVLGGPAGLPATSYGPDLHVRRDQMASFLVRAAELATGLSLSSAAGSFDDVGAANAHFEQVNGAAQHGLVQGFGDGTYRPDQGVRRDQLASFTVRLVTALADGSFAQE